MGRVGLAHLLEHTLVVLLQARNQVGLVSGLGEAALGEKLLQVGDLQEAVVGHGCGGLMGVLVRRGVMLTRRME